MPTLNYTNLEIRKTDRVLKRALPVLREIEALLPTGGRPRAWTVREIFALLLLCAKTGDFQINNAAAIARALTKKQRRILGSRFRSPSALTVRQIGWAFGQISGLVDPYRAGLSHDERAERLRRAARWNSALLEATIPAKVLTRWKGDVAIDTTLVWAWGRPRNSNSDKLYATGSDGGGAPTYIHVHDASDDFDFSPEALRYPWHQKPHLCQLVEPDRPDEVTETGRKRRRDRGKRATGVDWIGNTSHRKIVYGEGHHQVVLVPPTDQHSDLPNVAIATVASPATGNPALHGTIALEAVAESLPNGPKITSVLSDAGFSQAKDEHWLLPLQDRGFTPIFRLHAGNQEGHRATLRDGEILMIDGAPHCRCCPDELRNLVYPHQPKTPREQKVPHWEQLAQRGEYRLKPNSARKAHGQRQFRSPHHGDCPQCRDLPADRQCCRQATHSFTREELARYQPDVFGSPEWERAMNRRSRVEGFFGLLKNKAVVDLCRATMRFFEFGKRSLAVTIRTMTANLHAVQLWEEREKTRTAKPAKRCHSPDRLRDFKPTGDPSPPATHSRPPPQPTNGLDFLAEPLPPDN